MKDEVASLFRCTLIYPQLILYLKNCETIYRISQKNPAYSKIIRIFFIKQRVEIDACFSFFQVYISPIEK